MREGTKGKRGLLAGANSNVVFFDNEELILLIGMIRQDEGEPLNLQAQGRIRPKPQENNTSVGVAGGGIPARQNPTHQFLHTIFLIHKSVS